MTLFIDACAPARAITHGPFHPRDPGLVHLLGLGAETTAGVSVTADTALGVSAWYAAVRAISEDVGKLPFMLYRRLDRRARERANDHPLWSLIHDDVSEEVSSQAHREALQGWALTWGNGYSEIVRDGSGRPLELRPMAANETAPERLASQRLVYRNTPTDGPTKILEAGDVFHVKGLGGDGIMGWSVLKLARESLGLTIAAEQFGSGFFGNDASPGGALKHPGELSSEDADRLRREWADHHAGPRNARRPAVLEEGMEWQSIGIPAEDAQFLETREFQVNEMARWFRMPPHKLQQLLRATFSNIEHLAIEYVVDTLMPWLKRWEHEATRKLLGVSMRGQFFVEFLVEALLRGDSAARAKFYRDLFNIGVMSRNEIRERENLNPIEDESGDTYYVQTNMGDASKVAAAEIKSGDANQSPQTPAPDDEGPQDRAVIGPSHRYLVAESLTRAYRVEHDKVKRAARREQDFGVWLKTFHAEHVQHVRSWVGAAVDAFADALAWKLHGRELTDDERKGIVSLTGRMAAREIERSAALIEQATNRAEALSGFEPRADDAAGDWIDAITEYVRSLSDGGA